MQTKLANASTSAEISSLTSQLSAAQSALADAIAENQTAVSGVTADITALEASVAELKTSLANAATSEESEAIQAQLTAAQTALEDAIASASNGVTDNATAIEALETALDELATNLAALQTSLNAAATAAEVEELQTALAAAQADLSEILAQNNVYTGDITITNASTLAAAEQLGNKVRIVNGSVGITHNSSVDATKLAAVMAKMVTITGSVTYTHALSDVEPVSFTKLTSAGNIKLDQDGPISLPVLASTGLANLVYDAKVTSISLPKLETVSQFSSDAIGGANTTSIDLSSLKFYDNSSLTLTLKSSGDTSLKLDALSQLAPSTGLPADLNLTVTGGDDLSLPVYQGVGFISATNVKALSLPKFDFKGTWGSASADGDINVTDNKLETLALHKVRGNVALTGALKLTSIDLIGTVDESVATPNAISSKLIMSGSAPALTTISLAGKFKEVDIQGATDISSISTSGMIQIFSLQDTEELTELTLSHKGLSGFTSSSDLNASNRTQLVIQDNLALTSFSASEIASLGKLHIKGNSELTSFSLKSTLSLGTNTSGGSATTESVDVEIKDNDLSGSVQLQSEYNAATTVAGKITQSSLNNISSYLAAAEAAISTPSQISSGAVRSTWNYTTGVYSETTTTATNAGAAVSTFSSVSVDVKLDLASETTAAGVTTSDLQDYVVIGVGAAGDAGEAAIEKQAITSTTFQAGTLILGANGGSKSFTIADATASVDLTNMTQDPLWASFGVSATYDTGINKRTVITLAGTVSASDDLILKWGPSNIHSVTYSVNADGDSAATSAAGLRDAFNTYVTGSASSTLAETARAMVIGDAVVITTGTYSPSTGNTDTEFFVDPNSNANHHTGIVFATDVVDSTVSTPTATVSQVSDYILSVSATTSATATTASGLGVIGGTEVSDLGSAHSLFTSFKSNSTGLKGDREFTAAVPGTPARITKRATWLD